MGSKPTRRWWPLLIAAVAIPLAVAAGNAAGQDAGPASPTGADLAAPPTANQPYAIAFLNPYPQDTFWQVVEAAILERAATAGVTVDVLGLETPSAPEQVAQFETVVAEGYDGVVVGVIDPTGAVPGIVAANAAGLPVVAIDIEPAGGEIVSLVQTDDVAAGRAAGQTIVDAIAGRGSVLNLQGDLLNDVARERDRGLRDALDAAPGVRVLSISANWDEDEAAQIVIDRVPDAPATPDLFASTPVAATPVDPNLAPSPTPDVPEAIFAANEAMTRGAAAAVAAVGRDEEIVLVGFGTILVGVEAVESGELTAVVAPFPARTGSVAVDVMVRHLNGEAVPPEVDSGFVVVTDENVDRLSQNDAP